MGKMVALVRGKLSSTKARVAMIFMACMMALSTSAFAADPTVDTTAVTGAFSSIATTVMVVIAAVAGTAVVIMGTILAWKYGRKLFGMIAK